jgi:sulfoxide reductase heme-binding subunit YedZ
MNAAPLAQHGWWLASRASGLIALVLITISVGLGLTMAGRVSRRPGLARSLTAIHEQTALAGLVAIGVHGVTLLGDAWLNPGPRGILVPFAMSYRPLWTSLGIVAGYIAAALGLSFYIRRFIGPRLWRKAHRATVVVYALAVAHTLGAGTDASTPWLRWWLVVTAPLLLILFLVRLGASARAAARAERERTRKPRARSRRPRVATPRRALSEEAG